MALLLLTAAAIGSLSVVGGLLLSYHRNTAAGATMAFCTVAIFVATLTVKAAVAAFKKKAYKSGKVAQV